MSEASEASPAQLSVVVPIVNEATRITARLDELSQLQGVSEVIVCDGGSTDGSLDVVERHSSTSAGLIRLLRADRGRARQMNAGAKAASHGVVLFLHADTQLPSDACQLIDEALREPGVVFGAFRTHTVDDTGKKSARWLRLADLRSRYTTTPYGDQALFVKKRAFFAAGGFPDQPLMEETELCLRLQKLGRFQRAAGEVRVSGRRFLARPFRDTLLVNVFPLLYRLGVSPRRLKGIYEDVR